LEKIQTQKIAPNQATSYQQREEREEEVRKVGGTRCKGAQIDGHPYGRHVAKVGEPCPIGSPFLGASQKGEHSQKGASLARTDQGPRRPARSRLTFFYSFF
jgi:hypothetical protein